MRPVARVLQVEGKAEAHSAADQATPTKPRPLAVYGSLYASDTIRLEANATVVIGFRGSGELQKIVAGKTPRTVTITKRAVQPSEGVKRIVVDKIQPRVVGHSISQLPEIKPNGATVTRGPPADPPYPTITPIADSAVLDAKPQFSWPAVKDAQSYSVSVYQGRVRLWTAKTGDTSLRYAAAKPLEQGEEYRWRVMANTAEGATEACHAMFSVAFADEASGPGEMVASEQPALVALAAASYEQLNLLSQAIAAYEWLAAQTPDAAPIHAALSELYERAGRGGQARKARQTAIDLGFKYESPDTDAEPTARPSTPAAVSGESP